MDSWGMGSSNSGSFLLVSHHVLLWVEQADTSDEPRYLFLWLPSFLITLLHTFQEAVSALRVFNMLKMYINSLGKNLALNLFTTMPTAG